jgi:hypothetical protein
MTRPTHCPFGFEPDPDDPERLVENAEEQRAIKLIRERRGEGLGLREIARSLDDDGVPCRGDHWNHVTIANVLNRAE